MKSLCGLTYREFIDLVGGKIVLRQGGSMYVGIIEAIRHYDNLTYIVPSFKDLYPVGIRSMFFSHALKKWLFEYVDQDGSSYLREETVDVEIV